MSTLAQARTYHISASESDIPQVLTSSNLKKPIPSVKKTISVVSQNGNQGPNGFSTFYVQGNNYILPGTAYLRCTFTPSGGAVADSYGFCGISHSGASIIRLLNINSGSTPAETINFYNKLNDLLLSHCANRDFIEGDLGILMKSSKTVQTYSANESIELCIPLFLSGLLNGDRAIPLWLMPQGLQIEIQYDSLLSVITPSAGSTYNNYTISNAQFVYESVEVDQAYKDAVRMRMMGDPSQGLAPALYQLNVPTFMNSKFSKGTNATLTTTVGLNVSSLKAIFTTLYQDPAAVNTELTYFSRNIGASSLFEVLVDGQNYSNLRMNTAEVFFAELQKCMATLGDISTSFAFPGNTASATRLDYLQKAFLAGQGFRRFNENNGLTMTGTPCSNLQITYQSNGGELAGDNMLLIALYDTILTISPTGEVNMIR